MCVQPGPGVLLRQALQHVRSSSRQLGAGLESGTVLVLVAQECIYALLSCPSGKDEVRHYHGAPRARMILGTIMVPLEQGCN